jgi:hypothetical protein
VPGSWDITGLRRTGSFDWAVEDVFLPERRTMPQVGIPLENQWLVRVAPSVKAGNHVHSLVHDPKGQRMRKASAPSAADVSVDNRETLWPAAIRSTTASTSAVKLSASSASRALYQSRASISSARAAEPNMTDNAVNAVVEVRP